MKIVMSNYHYRQAHVGGGSLHIEAFIRYAVSAGHRLYSGPTCRHDAVTPMPAHALGQWWHLRDADLNYVRLHEAYPRKPFSRWFTPPLRRLAPRPRLVWEFNTVPEQGECIGQQSWEIEQHKAGFRQAARWCDLAVCVSEALADYARDELGIANTLVVPNGANPRPLAVSNPTGNFDVIWAGSAYIQWNEFELMLDAARLLACDSRADRIRFHLYGPGTEKLTGLPANVTAHGPVSHAEVESAMAHMQLALCLYQRGTADYGSPLKYFDCLAASLPVATTPHPQMDAVQHATGSDDLIVTDWTSATLASIVKELSGDEARRRERAERGHQIIEETYNWSSLMRRLFVHLEELVHEQP